ncbi:uncharacterized protein LOC129760890 [Uranotaenia lowii]|uniref:uncharacterized protein LOC129760890 n=1 Tax=Uranotaenia lowii TaxID=190385 RepID=UPI002479B16F|nr:uncharacterized protein LOC129760890 [Uranotaenia lowii]
MEEFEGKSSTGYDNGAVAPKRKVRKGTIKGPKVTIALLKRKLKQEKIRSSALATKLKRARSEKRQLVEPTDPDIDDCSFMQKHSTMRESHYSHRKDESMLVKSMNNLSVATLNVPECKPPQGEDDVTRKSFEQWKELLEASMDLAGIESESTKMRFFKIKAGQQLMDILDNTTSSADGPDFILEPYSDAIFRLQKYFGSRQYLASHRQKLRSMVQTTGESDLSYVKRVISAAKMCDFDDEQLVENVADVIQCHSMDVKMRDIGRKIFRKGSSLSDLVEKVRSHELDKLNEEVFAKTHSQSTENSVAAVTFSQQSRNRGSNGRFQTQRGGYQFQNRGGYQNPYRGGSQTAYRGAYQSTFRGGYQPKSDRNNWRNNQGPYFRPNYDSSSIKQPVPCWRCTANFHDAEDCSAKFKVCDKCGLEGHIQRACSDIVRNRCSKLGEKRRNQNSHEDAVAPKTKRILKVSNDGDMNDQTNGDPSEKENAEQLLEIPLSIGKVGDTKTTEELIVGRIADVPVEFLIDSGAEVNTISSETFKLLSSSSASRDNLYNVREGSDKPLRAYAQSEVIPVKATFVAELYLSDDRPILMEKFYVISGARALLGRETAIRYSVLQLGLRVPVGEDSAKLISSLLAGELNTLSEGAEFPKFVMPAVTLSYDASKPPSRNIYTNIPPAFRQETEKRLNELLESGIIERVTEGMNKSFCSSLLVVPKGKEDIRMPTLDSILANLDGAKWFSTLDLTSAYFHVELSEESRHLTNFFAGSATYRFKRLPFGLTNAPDIFQEAMETIVLNNCPGSVNYLDDVLVHEEEEFNHLKREALQTIKRLGYFDYKHKTELYVDASPIGLGAVLIQFDDKDIP